jgi:tripartite-type tricarboxylate transporter receptor subunit TctC
MTVRRNLLGLVALGLAALMASAPASAQSNYPNKPVRWLVGYVPGGTTDILARLIGQHLSEKLGQQFIIENKAGAGNNLAVEALLAAPADGYTVLLVNPANGINATLYKKLSFNFIRDVAPVGGILRVPNVMVVNNDVPAKTVKEFIDHVKANPGKVNMASSGNGTSVHLSGELFMAMTGIKMAHVPYRGSNPALTDPKIKARLADLGGVPMGGTPEDFGKIIVSETEKWKKVVEFSGASVD